MTELAQKFHLDLPLKDLKKIGARADAPTYWPKRQSGKISPNIPTHQKIRNEQGGI